MPIDTLDEDPNKSTEQQLSPAQQPECQAMKGSEREAIAEIEQYNQQLPEAIRRYASGHYLSNLAYVLAEPTHKETKEVRVLTEQGTLKKYAVYPIPLKEGFYGYILLPKNQSSYAKVIFRGTDFADLSSTHINLEMFGPGSESFFAEKNWIFYYLQQVLQHHYGKIPAALALQVCGHSQGAALSQLFCAELLVLRQETADWDNVKKLTMTVLNSPGIPLFTAWQAEEALKAQQPTKPLQVIGNYYMVGGDLVQVTGWRNLFATLAHNVAEVTLLKVNKGFEGAWFRDFDFKNGIQLSELLYLAVNAARGLLGAHPNNNFFIINEDGGKITLVNHPYQYFTNTKLDDVPTLQKELLNKALLLQLVGFIPREMLYYVVDFINTDVKQMFNEFMEAKDLFSQCYRGAVAWFRNRIPIGQAYEVKPSGVLAPTQPSSSSNSSQDEAHASTQNCCLTPTPAFLRRFSFASKSQELTPSATLKLKKNGTIKRQNVKIYH